MFQSLQLKNYKTWRTKLGMIDSGRFFLEVKLEAIKIKIAPLTFLEEKKMISLQSGTLSGWQVILGTSITRVGFSQLSLQQQPQVF